MAITASDVMSLRHKTGLGMMECKAALTETNGDMEKAIDLMRQRGLAKMDTRADRMSAEGRVAIAISPDQSKGSIIEVNTETDFTAGNASFAAMMKNIATQALQQKAGQLEKTAAMQAEIDNVRITTKENVQFGRGMVLGGAGSKVGSYVHFTGKVGVMIEVTGNVSEELMKDLCMHISAVSPTPLGVNESDVPQNIIDKEKEIARSQALESGKPAQIAEKMVEGKIRKYLDEVVLLRQLFVKDEEKHIKDLLPAGTSIKSFARFQVGG